MRQCDINSMSDTKPNIDYPCMWGYRVIGLTKEVVLNAISNVLGDEVIVSPNEHFSSSHKYVAINCQIRVESNEERMKYFDSLVNQSGIIMVI